MNPAGSTQQICFDTPHTIENRDEEDQGPFASHAPNSQVYMWLWRILLPRHARRDAYDAYEPDAARGGAGVRLDRSSNDGYTLYRVASTFAGHIANNWFGGGSSSARLGPRFVLYCDDYEIISSDFCRQVRASRLASNLPICEQTLHNFSVGLKPPLLHMRLKRQVQHGWGDISATAARAALAATVEGFLRQQQGLGPGINH